MEGPKELSLNEIRKYMLDNGCKVTNHSLVKHFKRFLTHPDTQIEARKEFKTYVNILATIKNENNQKYLILRKKYLTECPSEDVVQRAISQAGGGGSEAVPSSPGGVSLTSDEAMASPLRKPPPYIPPPEVSTTPTVAMYEGTPLAPMVEITHATEDDDTIKTQSEGPAYNIDGQKLEAKANEEKSVSRVNSVDETANKENIPRFSFSSGSSATDSTDMGNGTGDKSSDSENPMSVKEATRKFNRMASEEEAKIISPPTKKKPEKQLIEEKELPEVTLAHPKAKEWIVAMAKASYQELAKLATDHPELVKLQDPSTGYTALHWGAKHGNEDVIKLIAGTYKANVNATTNGGYTPLHIAMQFGRVNVFALLCNTYKANRDLLDWAGNKALDYSKQQTSVSASTYSSEYCSKFLLNELNNNYHFELPPNMKNTGGGTVGSALTRGKKRSQLTYATISGGSNPLSRTQSLLTTSSRRREKKHSIQSMKFNNNNNTDEASLMTCDIMSSPQSSPESTPRSMSPSDGRANNVSDGIVARRKESFLRKTLRAATASNRYNSNYNNNPDNVTNKILKELAIIWVSVIDNQEIKAKRKPTVEKDLGFLRIGSLNVRVKKTTEAFSNFLGVGNGNGSSMPSHHHPPHAVSTASLPHQRPHRHHHYPHHLHHVGTTRNQHHLHPMMMKKSSTTMITKKNMHHLQPGSRASAPINSKQFDMLHKSWGSADNITRNGSSNSVRHHHHDNDDESLMPPPKDLDSVKKRQKNAKRSSISSNATDSPRDSLSSTASSNFNSGYSSMPTTPNQLRSPLGLVGVAHNLNGDSDSDSACGFDSNWSINGREFPK
ncbi:uncharacterized protein LOC106091120 [Stomoxys calcitrans]|uniref:uncharacterized protein LOC106091120 n=1 Tax=Stomoxys calcitrans TaxID=35570 RepID=UPI0027E30F3A|nr:uncharacterized protein LOC106091120 [Stomoxys calcitrans]